jgi:hypothetical protein
MEELERLRKENNKLKEKVEYYEGLPSAKFYNSLIQGIDHLRKEIDSKSLNFDDDPFAKSVMVLAEKSDKIFSAIEKGINSFVQEVDTKSKQSAKSGTKAL